MTSMFRNKFNFRYYIIDRIKPGCITLRHLFQGWTHLYHEGVKTKIMIFMILDAKKTPKARHVIIIKHQHFWGKWLMIKAKMSNRVDTFFENFISFCDWIS